MLDELEWPSLEASRDLSSLLLFHKIYFGDVFTEIDTFSTLKKISQPAINMEPVWYRERIIFRLLAIPAYDNFNILLYLNFTLGTSLQSCTIFCQQEFLASAFRLFRLVTAS